MTFHRALDMVAIGLTAAALLAAAQLLWLFPFHVFLPEIYVAWLAPGRLGYWLVTGWLGFGVFRATQTAFALGRVPITFTEMVIHGVIRAPLEPLRRTAPGSNGQLGDGTTTTRTSPVDALK